MKKNIFVILLFIIIFHPIADLKALRKKQIEKHYQYLKKIILQPKSFNTLQKSFQIITLSFISQGLKNYLVCKPELQEEISELIERIIIIAKKYPSAPVKDVTIKTIKKLSGYGLYNSHLNIILINYYLITKDKKYFNLNQELNSLLLKEISRNKNMHISAYPHYKSRFPADQAAVCYSLWLYDRAYKTNLSDLIIKKWTARIKTSYCNKKYMLPFSEINYRFWYSPYPRGCATPYLIYYTSFFSPKLANEFWINFKIHFKGNLGNLTLFKEWLTDKKNKHYTRQLSLWKKWHGKQGDADTGPVINGYGAAATGISLLAARATEDNITYEQVLDSVTNGFTIIKFINKKFYKRFNNPLAIAIIFTSETM